MRLTPSSPPRQMSSFGDLMPTSVTTGTIHHYRPIMDPSLLPIASKHTCRTLHWRTTLLWLRENGEVELQNRPLLKAIREAQPEGKNWQEELQNFLLAYRAYRATEHTTSGQTLSFLLFRPNICNKLADVFHQIQARRYISKLLPCASSSAAVAGRSGEVCRLLVETDLA